VADDHGFIRAGVEAVLRGTPFQVVATAASGEEALAAIEQHNPAVVLLDINMPGLNGVAALEALREKGDERPVVLLTAEITDRQLMAVMRAGVQGIVSKDGAESELVQVLERVHAGEKAIAPAFLQRALDLSLKPVVNPFAKLNARERDITRLVAKGMRNREIGQQLNIGEGP
jgi:two-component system nitrate/nitrite response regulator NarP